MKANYSVLEINLFDNTEGIDTCVSCKTFNGAWIYCPVFNHIMQDGSVKFDETGELNRCELFSKNREKETPHVCDCPNRPTDHVTESGWVCHDCKLPIKLFWQCKYCGDNGKPKCHKCVREDGKIVSDELSSVASHSHHQ